MLANASLMKIPLLSGSRLNMSDVYSYAAYVELGETFSVAGLCS